MPSLAIVSFRLRGTDGVSVEAAKWEKAFRSLGWAVRTVAGQPGPGQPGDALEVDVVLPGLGIGAVDPPTEDEVRAALHGVDVVVIENLCSLPLNPGAAASVAAARKGQPTILHHHDLPWQRPHLAHHPAPLTDPAWRHVTINDLSRQQLSLRGIEAVTIRNAFDPDTPKGGREEIREALRLSASDMLFLQPTRAIYRKNVPGGLALAEHLGAAYWLLGETEDGFGPRLGRLVKTARTRVVLGTDWFQGSIKMADAYAASDAVLLPSTWEGFGNPTVESALHERPLVIGPYPVAHEIKSYGFRWFLLHDRRALAGWLDEPDDGLLTHNAAVARRHFNMRNLPERLDTLLRSLLSG